MKIIPKTGFNIASLPLPIYEKVLVADATSKDGDNFLIYIGMDEKIIAELKKLSLDKTDEEIQKNTSDRKRFGEGSYENWYKKERTPFVLIQKNTGKLAALMWFGPEPLEGNTGNLHTSAWRAYPNFRGKGLMKEFAKFVMDIYTSKIPNVKFWAVIKKENIGSMGYAQAIGFKDTGKTLPDGSIIVIK